MINNNPLKKKKSKLPIKRNPKMELLITTFVVIVIGIFTVITIFAQRPNNKPSQTFSPNVQNNNTLQPSEQSSENFSEIENNENMPSEEKPSEEPSFVSVSSFPLTSENVKSIEITSATNGICNKDNEWKLKFFINNKNASKQKKYAYHIIAENGHVFINYDGGLDFEDFENAVNFLYSEEYGNMSPILYDGVTWSPPIEPILSTKFFVKVIDIESKNVESCFNILVQRDKSGYKITGLESAEFNNVDKEKIYNQAVDYYKTKGGGLKLEDVTNSVVALSPKIENDMYYIDNIAYNGINIRPVVVAYIKYNTVDLPFKPSQGCFILYFNKDTLKVIGEGKMTFLE